MPREGVRASRILWICTHTFETLTAAKLKPRRHENRVYFDDPDGLTVQVAGKNNRP